MSTKAQREYRRTYDLERYHRRRQEVLDHLGNKCMFCGAVEDLQIDHVDPTTKSFDVAKGWGRAAAELWKEIAKCQLLCRSCHKIKTAKEQRVDVHGTWGMWRNRKCRCPVCRAFFNAYHAAWKRKKRMSV